MPKYTLTTSLRSPFGRLCRLFMIKHDIAHEVRFLNFVDNKEEAEILSKETPINKVPILDLGNGETIFDSRVIINYLIKKHKLPELSIDEENLVSAIYSCMDVSVILFLMKANGYDINASDGYMKRQRERIPRNLEYIKSWMEKLDAKNSKDWNYASMSLFSFLYWADLRAKTINLQEQPQLQKFVEKFSQAPGVSETGF